MVDNYDSFTFNIVQYCEELGAHIQVIKNDQMSIAQIEALQPAKIIISPGPSTPDKAGISLAVIAHFKDKLPILGICLGHQSIAQHFGATIIQAKEMMHGKTSTIEVIKNTPIFIDIPRHFTATRYHSLIVDPATVTDDMTITATSKEDKAIMALEINNKPIYGIQFHPESILSEYGKEIIGNFLNI